MLPAQDSGAEKAMFTAFNGADQGTRGPGRPPRPLGSRAAIVVIWALIVGLVIWVSAWALGVQAFDAFLVLLLLVVGAIASGHKPFLDQQLGR